jgi:hypothetical protein
LVVSRSRAQEGPASALAALHGRRDCRAIFDRTAWRCEPVDPLEFLASSLAGEILACAQHGGKSNVRDFAAPDFAHVPLPTARRPLPVYRCEFDVLAAIISYEEWFSPATALLPFPAVRRSLIGSTLVIQRAAPRVTSDAAGEHPESAETLRQPRSTVSETTAASSASSSHYPMERLRTQSLHRVDRAVTRRWIVTARDRDTVGHGLG